MCIDPTCRFSQLFPHPPPFLIHLTLWPSSYTLQDQFMMPRYFWMCGFSLAHGGLIRSDTHRENFLSLSPPAVNSWQSSMTKCGIVCQSPMMAFGLTWACIGFVHVVGTAVCFLVGMHYLWLLDSFCSSSLTLGGGCIVYMFPLSRRYEDIFKKLHLSFLYAIFTGDMWIFS